MVNLDHCFADCRKALQEHSLPSAMQELIARAMAYPREEDVLVFGWCSPAHLSFSLQRNTING